MIYANCVTITAHRRHKKKHKARMRQNASHVENQFCREQKSKRFVCTGKPYRKLISVGLAALISYLCPSLITFLSWAAHYS